MQNIIEQTSYKIFYISPNSVKYCISPSVHCDYTQFNSSTLHPHAGQDRGVFKEDPKGCIRIINSDWDLGPGILFSKLYEYQSLHNHYLGKENWKKSKFAQRYYNYIKAGNVPDRGFQNADDFLLGREPKANVLVLARATLPLSKMSVQSLWDRAKEHDSKEIAPHHTLQNWSHSSKHLQDKPRGSKDVRCQIEELLYYLCS